MHVLAFFSVVAINQIFPQHCSGQLTRQKYKKHESEYQSSNNFLRSEQIRPAVAIMQELSVVNNPNPVAVIH